MKDLKSCEGTLQLADVASHQNREQENTGYKLCNPANLSPNTTAPLSTVFYLLGSTFLLQNCSTFSEEIDIWKT